MSPVDIVLVGCGMMGARHLRGYGELERALPGSLRLRAVCDPNAEAADRVAAEAEELLGYRPRACRTAEEALTAEGSIVAADVVTDNRSHDAIVVPLLEAGLHVQCEKPLAVTIPRGQAMIAAAKRANRLLVVAENNRRDPMNRLVRHVVQSGLIGDPFSLQQVSVTPSNAVFATPWRHAWAMGGLAMDVGIHFAYILESFLGPIDTVFGCSKQVLAQRLWSRPGREAEWVDVECPDIYDATLTFQSGAQGSWITHFAGAGPGQWLRRISGTEGTLDGPGDRSGGAVKVARDGGSHSGDDLLAAVPGFALSDAEARLFGQRPSSYSFEGTVTDRKLLAAETANFVAAIRGEEPPEVPGEVGIRAVAIVLALLESCLTGEPVKVADALNGSAQAAESKIESAA